MQLCGKISYDSEISSWTDLFYVSENDVELKNNVDSALSQIISGNTDYLINLKNKYETKFNGGVLPLSSVENDYIREHPTSQRRSRFDDAPYYKRNSDGTAGGSFPIIMPW